MSDYDPGLRFRLWIAGHLTEETWVDTSDPEAERLIDTVSARHRSIAARAYVEGLPVLIEVYDPAQSEDEAYFRFGDDTAGMVDPRPWSP